MNGIWILVILLLVASAALLVASFFKKDSGNHFQEEVEELSLDMLHDIHLLKQRVAFLEQQMGIVSPEENSSERVLEITKKQVVKLYTRGVGVQEIAEELKIHDATVQTIIDEHITDGMA